MVSGRVPGLVGAALLAASHRTFSGGSSMNPLTTMELARQEGVQPWRIRHLLNSGRIPAPPKNSSGDYQWGPQHIAALRKALAAGRRRKAVSS